MPLKNKRILFLSARTFGIPENITQTMEALGATVDFYDVNRDIFEILHIFIAFLK